MNYLYKNLSPDDFEELAQDVISHIRSTRFEKFKPGKDQGIDLRLIEYGKTVIAQVKHLYGSYSSSHRNAFKQEYQKAKNIQQIRDASNYILITSSNLSAQNKKEIHQTFDGLIRAENDIYGIEDIEQVLRENEAIARRHFKLWISSSHVLVNVLNNRVYGKSEDYCRRIIQEKIQLFVTTKNVDNAIEILTKNHVLVVTGEPGIGKTTLSEFLCIYFLGKDYNFIYCDSIDEIEDVYTKDTKQIFLLDDFLGSNFLDTFSGKEESKILRLIDRFKSHSNKYLVLNSRTTIYQQASNKGIHWGEANWPAFKYCLDISDYSEIERAKMLYNHLKYKGIDDEYFEEVRSNKEYFKIIRHPNFNPRIIEAVTSKERLTTVSPSEYIQHIYNSLSNPNDVWKSAYKAQINNEQRWLLQTLFTFKGEAKENSLLLAYRHRLQFETTRHGQRIDENAFKDAIMELMDGFICRSVEKQYNESITRWKFINPSIFDYLIRFFAENPDAVHSIMSSIYEISQWETLFSIDSIKQIILTDESFDSAFYGERYQCNARSNIELEMIILAIRHKIQISDNVLLDRAISGFAALPSDCDTSVCSKILSYIRQRNLYERFYEQQNDLFGFCKKLLCLAKDFEDFESFVNEFDCTIPGWGLYLEEPSDFSPIKLVLGDLDVIKHLDSVVKAEASSMLADDDRIPEITDKRKMEAHIERLEQSLYDRLTYLGYETYEMPDFAFDFDCNEQISENLKNLNDDDDEYYAPATNEQTNNALSYSEIIENVFRD